MIKVSLFSCSTDNLPKPVETSWDQFVASFGPHNDGIGPEARDKGALPMFSSVDYPPGKTRSLANVSRIYFGVLDIDHVEAGQLLDVLRKVEGLNAFLYTTWSHSKNLREKGLWSVRIGVEFSRPLVAQEWRSFWPRFAGHFGMVADPKCKDPSRAYYGAFAPPGTERDQEWIVFRGAPLDVDALRSASAPVVIQGTQKIPRDRLERLATRWKRSRDEWRATMGDTLSKLCKGEPFAEPGDIDNTVFQLCQDLAEAFPGAEPLSLAEHFIPSLSLMTWKQPWTPERVAEKLERALANRAAEEAAAQEEELTELRLRIRQAFAHVDPRRDWPYTDPEIETMCQKMGVTREELAKLWLIQRGDSFYVLGPGAVYSDAYTSKDVMHAVIRDLAPAKTAGVNLWGVGASGESFRKPLSTLMGEYGTVATNYVLDLTAQEARYEPSQRLFIEAPCPLRKLTPAYDWEVDGWLRLLCGDRIQDVLTFLACATDLRDTCAALMLTGAKGTGKSLLAHGLARLWRTSGPVPMSSAMDPAFNEALAKCPLVFADEQLPKDFKGHGRTAEIREFIASRSRPYKRKFAHETVMLGATRTIIAANNEDVLAIAENLSVNDIEAVSDRFYHVQVNSVPMVVNGCVVLDAAGQPVAEPAYYLSLVDAAGFIHEDRIARHALWLRDNHRFVRQGRFLIKSPDKGFYRALTTKSGIRSAVCQWLVGYVREPARVDSARDYRVRIHGGRLLVTTKGILDNWALYVSNVAVPETGRLAQAISGLSKDTRPHVAAPGQKARNYREIDLEHVIAWAQQTEFATEDDIREALKTDTEERLQAGRLLQRLTN